MGIISFHHAEGQLRCRLRKKALRQMTYGLYVVTSMADDVVGASTVNWLSQASFDPPLVMVAVKGDSGLHSAVEKSGTFAIDFSSSSVVAISL